MQARIGDYNEHLKNWCELNCTSFVETDPSFRLGTGEVDDMCYDMESNSPGSTLNRIGAPNNPQTNTWAEVVRRNSATGHTPTSP
ncbi:hypothetical protein Pmani_038327, partial [Petrolisthes manimaculis]